MEQRIRKLYVEASSRCNLACKMCFRHSWIGEEFGGLDSAVFARIMDDPALNGTETVFFGGMGEPLVHPALTKIRNCQHSEIYRGVQGSSLREERTGRSGSGNDTSCQTAHQKLLPQE